MPTPSAADDADQVFRLIETNMYRVAWLGAPVLALLALAAGHQLNLLTPTYVALVSGLPLLILIVCINYHFRRHSLRAWIVFLVISTLAVPSGLAGLMLVDMVYGDPKHVSARLLREWIIPIEVAAVGCFAVGLAWALYGNLRRERQATIAAAFQQRVLTPAQVARLFFFSQGKSTFGPELVTTIGAASALVVGTLHLNRQATWNELVPFTVFVVLTCITALLLGQTSGFFVSTRKLFVTHGDIEIKRLSSSEGAL
jgi:hypothetical protein